MGGGGQVHVCPYTLPFMCVCLFPLRCFFASTHLKAASPERRLRDKRGVSAVIKVCGSSDAQLVGEREKEKKSIRQDETERKDDA